MILASGTDPGTTGITPCIGDITPGIAGFNLLKTDNGMILAQQVVILAQLAFT